MKLIYQVEDKPKFPQLIVFALQQLLAIMAATIAVPAIVGHDMSSTAALFGAGVGTLVYLLFTQFKSPVFLGSSFAFLGSMAAAFAGGVSMQLGYLGLILGALLALTPNVFITALMYIIGGILILGAINQYMNLINARRYGKVGFGFWVFPSVVLLIGLYVIIKPMAPASMAMLILGWCSLLYGVTELVNSLKFHADKRKYKQAQEVPVAEEIIEEPASVEAIKEEGPSDNTQLSVPTSSDTL